MITALLMALSLAAPPEAPGATPTAEPVPASLRPSAAMLVAIPAPKVQGDVSLRLQSVFEQSLLAELRKREGVGALGASEIGDVLSTAAEGRMRGCTRDDACLLEVASALGLNEIFSAEVTLDGGNYALMFRRLNAKTGKAVASESRKAAKKDGSELLDTIGPVVQSLYKDRLLKPGMTVGVDPEVSRRLNPPPLPRWVFFGTAASSLVALAAGATFGKLAKDTQGELNTLLDQSQSQPVSGAQVVSLQNQLNQNAKAANIFLGVGAVLGAAAIVEAFFTDWHDYRSQVLATPAPKPAR
jgi:hypothetical protein